MKKALLLLLPFAVACYGICDSEIEGDVAVDVCVKSLTRSSDPEENAINDINLFVFNEYGELEEHRYYRNSSTQELRLLLHKKYSFYACANMGWKLDINSLEELLSYRYWFAYPDDYRTGIPMSGCLEDVELEDFADITIDLERTMAKVSVRIDRNNLDSDISLDIRSIKVGGCPKSVKLFGDSNAEGTDDVFASGFFKSGDAVSALNYGTVSRISEAVSVYIQENMQGDLLEEDTPEKDKHFGDYDPRAKLCSFIDMKADYTSKSGSGTLAYRFYLGEGGGNFNVRRNCHYTVTIAPQGDGLGEDDWRIDVDGTKQSIESIELDRECIDFTYRGESVTLSVRTSESNSSPSGLRWKSSDSSVAEVSSSGTITATGEGECTIYCYADGTNAECKVNCSFEDAWVKFYTEGYIECMVGDTVHLGCDFFPPNTECDIGIEDMEYDKERGIYDFEIDEDGHGAKLIFRKKGTGLVQYALGSPINEAQNFLIICEP